MDVCYFTCILAANQLVKGNIGNEKKDQQERRMKSHLNDQLWRQKRLNKAMVAGLDTFLIKCLIVSQYNQIE